MHLVIRKIFPTTLPPAGVVPCKYRTVVAVGSRCFVDVGEVVGKRSDLAQDLR